MGQKHHWGRALHAATAKVRARVDLSLADNSKRTALDEALDAWASDESRIPVLCWRLLSAQVPQRLHVPADLAVPLLATAKESFKHVRKVQLEVVQAFSTRHIPRFHPSVERRLLRLSLSFRPPCPSGARRLWCQFASTLAFSLLSVHASDMLSSWHTQ